MGEHILKTDPEVFDAVWERVKQYELRKDDRPFAVGDMLQLRETCYTGQQMASGKPLKYTGRIAWRTIAHILRGPCYGLAGGWAILSFEREDQQNDVEYAP
jgi:hypothetical protein